jgi:hypothetical protein
MLTPEKIKAFKFFNGDIDLWARIGSRKEKALMEEEDWYLIENLIQDIKLVNKGLASSQFSDALEIKISDSCEDVETIKSLTALAENR